MINNILHASSMHISEGSCSFFVQRSLGETVVSCEVIFHWQWTVQCEVHQGQEGLHAKHPKHYVTVTVQCLILSWFQFLDCSQRKSFWCNFAWNTKAKLIGVWCSGALQSIKFLMRRKKKRRNKIWRKGLRLLDCWAACCDAACVLCGAAAQLSAFCFACRQHFRGQSYIPGKKSR